MSWDQRLDLQVFRNQLNERKKKLNACVGRGWGVRSKHLWSTFHSFIPLILFVPQSVQIWVQLDSFLAALLGVVRVQFT